MARKDMIGVERLDREVIMMAVDEGPYQGFMVQTAVRNDSCRGRIWQLPASSGRCAVGSVGIASYEKVVICPCYRY